MKRYSPFVKEMVAVADPRNRASHKKQLERIIRRSDGKQSMRFLDRFEREGYIERDSHAPESGMERYYKRTVKEGSHITGRTRTDQAELAGVVDSIWQAATTQQRPFVIKDNIPKMVSIMTAEGPVWIAECQ